MNEINFPLCFLALVLLVFLTMACSKTHEKPESAQRPPEKQAKHENINFPWDQRTALVVYAGHAENDDPDQTFPCLIFLEYDAKTNFLIIDGAPYLTVLTKTQMCEQLGKDTQKITNESDAAIHKKIDLWVNARIDEGFGYFFLELEPPELVGKAYPLARAAEKELD